MYLWVELPAASALSGEVYRINDKGQSVGTLITSSGDYGRHAVFYDGNALVDLALVPHDDLGGRVPAYANAINNLGQVVGAACGADGAHDCHAILYSGGTVVDIHPPGSYITSVATAINDAGVITGIRCMWEATCQGFVYEDGTYTFLENRPDGELNPWGINSANVMSGWWGFRNTFIYDAEGFHDLGPSCALAIPEARGFMDGGINESSQIAVSHNCQPHLYTSGTFEYLGVASGVAYGINDVADVVGLDFNTYTGWLNSAGTLYDLNDLIVNPVPGRRFALARDINNIGQIVGYGCDGAGVCRGARLDPRAPPIEVTVDGKASVYQIFGHPGSYWNDALDAVRVEVTPGTVAFRFSVSGGIHCAGSTGGVGTADGLNDGFCGAQPMNTQPYNGLSGVVGDLWFGLMGVFTTEADPYGQVPPEPIPFDADNPTSLSPALHQVFYIGDGRAGRDDLNGATLTFTPPAGATRLYLGYNDGFGGQPTGYADNVGAMTATIIPEGAGDSTPPIVQPAVVGTLGNNGWYVSDVQIAWTVTDPESSISETTGCQPSSVTVDTIGATFTCSATSQGGTATESVTIKRDTTPPMAIATAGPPPNANGWNRTNVTVTFTGTDATSGVESCDPPVILKTNGTGQSASGRCYDFAGNQSDLATASGINIDKTKPTVVITSPTSGAVYSVGEVVLASYSCDDALSGIVSCVGTVADGQPINTSKVSAVRQLKVTGKDAAGNSKSVTVKYAVQ